MEIAGIRFVPEFGNPDHLHIVEKLGKLEKMKKEYDNKVQAKRGAVALEKEIAFLERSINWLINRNNGNQTNT